MHSLITIFLIFFCFLHYCHCYNQVQQNKIIQTNNNVYRAQPLTGFAGFPYPQRQLPTHGFSNGNHQIASSSLNNGRYPVAKTNNNGGYKWDDETPSGRIISAEDDDIFIFDREDYTPRIILKPSTPAPVVEVAIPGMGIRKSLCEEACQTTPEYNPVCGDDSISYFSYGKLLCANKCGKRVNLVHFGKCRHRNTN